MSGSSSLMTYRTSSAERSRRDPADTSVHILVVEDEYLIALEVKGRLQHAGAQMVLLVPTVRRALDLIDDGDIDAAVLDLNLSERTTACPIAGRLSALGMPHLFATSTTSRARASASKRSPIGRAWKASSVDLRVSRPCMSRGLWTTTSSIPRPMR